MADAIAAPVPAIEVLPAWFRKLPAVDAEHRTVDDWAITIKRCMPFLDAMSAGYVLTLPAEIHFSVSADGQSVTHRHQMPFTLVESHAAYQIKGSHWDGRVPLKLNTQWVVTTPRGWSMLYVPLLNHANDRIETMAGLVDSDRYPMPVNLPFFIHTSLHGNSDFTLERGTPLCQLIPVKRSDFLLEARDSTPAEVLLTQHTELQLRSSRGWYRKFIREKR
jgi:hypothetical protein